MWKQHTRPRSASASHTGSHVGWFQSSSVGGSTGKYAATNPRSAARSISATAVAAFSSGNGRGAHVARRVTLELDRPVVDGRASRGEQVGIVDRRGPDADRRVDQLGPHALRRRDRRDAAQDRSRRARVRHGAAVAVDHHAAAAGTGAGTTGRRRGSSPTGGRRRPRCAACARPGRAGATTRTGRRARRGASHPSWPRSSPRRVRSTRGATTERSPAPARRSRRRAPRRGGRASTSGSVPYAANTERMNDLSSSGAMVTVARTSMKRNAFAGSSANTVACGSRRGCGTSGGSWPATCAARRRRRAPPRPQWSGSTPSGLTVLRATVDRRQQVTVGFGDGGACHATM